MESPNHASNGPLAEEVPLRFFVVADWGDTRNSPPVARAMARRAAERPIDFVISCGDHFYHRPVRNESDPKFRTAWHDVFLRDYPELRVPWHGCLGNHDYDTHRGANPDAQIKFTTSDMNKELGGCWQCWGKNYNFQKALPGGAQVHFFAVDTNACQKSVRKRMSDLSGRDAWKDLQVSINELNEEMSSSSGAWKIVFGHHPLYNNGLRDECDALRKQTGFEDVIVRNGAQAYFAGHEHVLQHHQFQGVDHFVVGTSGADYHGYYNGKSEEAWLVDSGWEAIEAGFVEVSLTTTRMQTLFMNVRGEIIKEVIHQKSDNGNKCGGYEEMEADSPPQPAAENALAETTREQKDGQEGPCE